MKLDTYGVSAAAGPRHLSHAFAIILHRFHPDARLLRIRFTAFCFFEPFPFARAKGVTTYRDRAMQEIQVCNIHAVHSNEISDGI